MNSNLFDFKLNDPIVAEDVFGAIGGFYKETIVDKNNVYIRFVRNLDKTMAKAYYIRNINTIRPSNVDEVNRLNGSL